MDELDTGVWGIGIGRERGDTHEGSTVDRSEVMGGGIASDGSSGRSCSIPGN